MDFVKAIKEYFVTVLCSKVIVKTQVHHNIGSEVLIKILSNSFIVLTLKKKKASKKKAIKKVYLFETFCSYSTCMY